MLAGSRRLAGLSKDPNGRAKGLTCHLPDSDLKLKIGQESRQDCLVLWIGPRWLIRFVEADKFDVWLVSIRVSMQLLRPRQGAGQEELRIRTGIRLRLGLGL